jgi:hypothetical protein
MEEGDRKRKEEEAGEVKDRKEGETREIFLEIGERHALWKTERKERQVTGKSGKRQAWWKTGRKERQVTGKGRNKTGMVEDREERETSYREERKRQAWWKTGRKQRQKYVGR